LGVDAYDYLRELRPWSQFLRFFDRLLNVEGSAVLEAYLHDPEVIDEMAKSGGSRHKPKPPSLFGWTATLAALRDIQDQLIASRGGSKFVPRPEIPGHKEMWRRRDATLMNTVNRITKLD
jgi:hypothetical protein